LRRHSVVAFYARASSLGRARRCESLRAIRAIRSRVEAAERLAQGVIQKKISHGESPHAATFVAWHARIHAGISSCARTRDSAHERCKNPGIIGISKESRTTVQGAAQCSLAPNPAHHGLCALARQARYCAQLSPVIERES